MYNLIVNPRGKHIRELVSELTAKLDAAGAAYDLFAGESKEETRALTARLTENPATVIAVGGDGTLNDVLCGIAHPETTVLGLIPAGTGNDFASAANIPSGAAALDLILHSEPVPTDFIQFSNGLRSMNIAGLGIDVDILERCYRMKRGGKRSKYFRSLLASLATYRGQRIEVTADGDKHACKALIAAVCNGKALGGGIPICPVADLGDGKLDLVVIDCPSRIRIPFELIRLMRGKILKSKLVRHVLCESVRVAQVEGTLAQLDGEIEEMRVMEAHVETGKLRMYRG